MNTSKNFGITVQAILDANAGVDLQTSLNKLSNLKIGLNVDSNLNNVQGDISNYSKEVKDASSNTNVLTEGVGNLVENVGKVAAWSLATNAIYGTKHALMELFDNIVEIESKMVELQRVTSGLDMSVMFDGAYESSQEYGAALYDTMDVITELGRTYGDLDEAQILATSSAAVLASTIADMSGEDAVKTLIAVSNAYGLLIEDSELLVDKLNEVDNNYAVSSTVLADGLRKSSATANTFGVELNTLVGYITAVSATTQESGNVIGNSLKTILSRLTTISEAETALDNVGISIRNATGEMRDSEEILTELAGQWRTLTSEQQQNIGLQVAGTHQLTRFLALMENFDIAVSATNTAINSQGSAVRENLIYMQSYEAKLNQLENSQLALSKAVGDSSVEGFGKTFIDVQIALTDVATFLFEISDATTIAITGLVALGVALSKTAAGKKVLASANDLFISSELQAAQASLASAEAQNKQVSGLTQLTNMLSLKGASEKASKIATEQYNLAAEKTNQANQAMASSVNLANKGFKELSDDAKKTAIELQASAAKSKLTATTFKALGVAAQVAGTIMKTAFSLGIGLLIGAIVNGISELINANQKAAEAALESASELDAQNQSLEENKNKIIEYKNALADANTSVETATMYKEDLLAVQQQLIDQYGDEADGIDLVNGSLEEQIEKINELKKLNADNWLNENQSAINAAQSELGKKAQQEWHISGDIGSVGTNQSAAYAAEWGQEQGYDVRKMGIGIKTDETPEEAIEFLEKYTQHLRDNKQELIDNGTIYESDFQLVLNDTSNSLNALNTKYATHIQIMKDFNKYSLEAMPTYYEFSEAIRQAGLDGELTGDDIKELIKDYDGLEEAFEKAGYTIEDLIKQYEILPAVMEDADGRSYIQNQEILNEETEKLHKNLDNIQSAYQTVAGAIAEYNETGYLSIDTMQKMLQLEDRYLVTLLDKNGNLQLNEQSYRNLVDAQLDEAEAQALNQAMIDITTINMQKEGAELNAVRAKYSALGTELQNVALDYNMVAQEAAKYKTIEGMSAEDEAAIKSAMSSLDSKLAIISKTRASINTSVSAAIGGSSSGSATQKTYFDYVNERLDVFSNNLKAIDLELEIVQERMNVIPEGTSAWFDNLDQQEAILKRRQNATVDYINALHAELRSTQLTNEERVELNNTIQELTLEYEEQNTALQDLLETEKDFYRSQIEDKVDELSDAEDKRHDQVIENIEDERDAFEEAINKQIDLIRRKEDAEDYDSELEDLQAEKQTIQNQINRLQGDDSRLANSQRLELEQELADLEEQILEHQLDRENDLREEALEDLQEQKDKEFDIYEEAENAKHELILNNLEEQVDGIDSLNITLDELNNQMDSLSEILKTFPDWADTFNGLAGVTGLSPLLGTATITGADTTNGQAQTFVINVTANSQAEGQEAGQAIVDELMKKGIITSGNTY